MGYVYSSSPGSLNTYPNLCNSCKDRCWIFGSDRQGCSTKKKKKSYPPHQTGYKLGMQHENPEKTRKKPIPPSSSPVLQSGATSKEPRQAKPRAQGVELEESGEAAQERRRSPGSASPVLSLRVGLHLPRLGNDPGLKITAVLAGHVR